MSVIYHCYVPWGWGCSEFNGEEHQCWIVPVHPGAHHCKCGETK